MPSKESKAVEHYHVIIESIGKANETALQMLSEILEMSIKKIEELLAQAPIIFFSDHDKTRAEECHLFLKNLGFISQVTSSSQHPLFPFKKGA